MDEQSSAALVAYIPFRALLSISKALGGVGADPHRLPGGKQGFADALITRYGAEAILKQWGKDKQDAPTPGGSDTGTPADVDSQSESSPEGSAPSAEEGQEGKGEAEGEAQTGESERKDEGGSTEAQGAGEEGKDEPKGTPTPDAPKEGDEPKGEETPADVPPCPSPDAPPPPPEKEGMMEASIRAIAKEEAARAVAPVAQWLNGTLVPHVGTLASRMGGGEAPIPGSQGYVPPRSTPAPKLPREGAIHHRLFPKFVALAKAGMQCILVGPGGTGKSHAARALAAHLGYAYGEQSLSSGVSESALMGWLLPLGEGGAFSYLPSPFVSLYAQGDSVFLMDEIGAASPDMLIIANAALANGGFTVPQRTHAPYVKRGERMIIAAATNCVDGADDMYSASQQMDAATFNRFYPLAWGHDPVLERSIVGLPAKQTYWTPKGETNWEGKGDQWERSLECAVAWVNTVAKAAATHRIPRLIGTRQSVMYRQALAAGCTHKEIRADLLMAWGPDEIAKLGDAAPKHAPAIGMEPSL